MSVVAWVAALLVAGQAVATAPGPFEPSRVAGTWYEWARFDTFFQRGCVATESTYTRQPDGAWRVVNRCRKDTLEGPTSVAEGKAWVPNPQDPTKWKVQFFWPFSGDLWWLEVGPDAQWALVGNPKKTTCWVLSRSRVVDEALYAELVAKLHARGFDTSALRRVAQPLPPADVKE